MSFKVGDWIKCTDPGDSLYGGLFKVVFSYDDSQPDNIKFRIESEIVKDVYYLTEEGVKYFVLAPIPFWVCNDQPQEQNKQTFTAPDILRKAEEIMRERGKQYDQGDNERSMEKIVNTFNAATGHELTEAQGWMFMIFLKLVRDNSRKDGHQDSCEDLTAYSALYGESRLS